MICGSLCDTSQLFIQQQTDCEYFASNWLFSESKCDGGENATRNFNLFIFGFMITCGRSRLSFDLLRWEFRRMIFIIYFYVNTNLYSVELRWLTECLAEFLRLHNSSLTDSTLQSKLTEFDLKVFRVAINSTQRKVKRYEMTFNINQTRNVSITSHRILKSNKSLVEREKREESQQQLQFIWLHFALHKKEAELKWKHAAFLRGWKITTDFISNEINDRKKY